MARAGKAAAEAEAVGEHELRLLRRDGRAFGILDHRRRGEGGVLAALRERDRLFRAERPGMEQVQVFRVLREQLGLGQARGVVLRVCRAMASAASTVCSSAARETSEVLAWPRRTLGRSPR